MIVEREQVVVGWCKGVVKCYQSSCSVPLYLMSSRVPYPYGNFPHYYDARNSTLPLDLRLALLPSSLFASKRVLDIGCNDGTVTLQIGAVLEPREVVGVDLDYKLVNKAVENWARRETVHSKGLEAKSLLEEVAALPLSYRLLLQGSGDLEELQRLRRGSGGPAFPGNVSFQVREVVSEGLPEGQFDTVLCLSTVKWIQLNWGDEGLQSLFRSIHAALSPLGHLVLEPQPWSSYKKLRNQSLRFRTHYDQIELRPPLLPAFLTSLGFTLVSTGVPEGDEVKERFLREVYVYQKAGR